MEQAKQQGKVHAKMTECNIEVDKELYEAAEKLCAKMGMTVEQACMEFLNFCSMPENKMKVAAFLGLDKDENGIVEYDETASTVG